MKKTQIEHPQPTGDVIAATSNRQTIICDKLSQHDKTAAIYLLLDILMEKTDEYKDSYIRFADGTIVYFPEACDILFNFLGGRYMSVNS